MLLKKKIINYYNFNRKEAKKILIKFFFKTFKNTYIIAPWV